MNTLKIELLAWDKMNDLIPAIVQDSNTLQVLMQGYVNRDALQTTQQSKRVTFYSRSKQRLWTKGESSNNYLELIDIIPDCDNDSLLILANPAGPTCHLGTRSCFEKAPQNSLAFLQELMNCIDERYVNRPEKSYTTQLFNSSMDRIAQKVAEEGVEVALAAAINQKDNLMNESADLIYHLFVLLRANAITLEDVIGCLHKRK